MSATGAVGGQAAARPRLSQALREAEDALARSGSASPRADAHLLAAHLLGVSPGGVRAAAVRGDAAPAGLAALVEARAAGVPVQHLTGRAAFRRLDLAVGPGVFVPRPETELVAGAAIAAARQAVAAAAGRQVTAVDLCTGSGAIAASIAGEVPGIRLYAVEIDSTAAGFARQNLRAEVRLVVGDATGTATLGELDGTVDVVVSNPPYVPDTAPVAVDAGQDPPLAVFGGARGWEFPLRIAERALGLLRPGGTLVIEHHDEGQHELLTALAALGYLDLTPHRDLAGRPRYIVGRAPGQRCV